MVALDKADDLAADLFSPQLVDEFADFFGSRGDFVHLDDTCFVDDDAPWRSTGAELLHHDAGPRTVDVTVVTYRYFDLKTLGLSWASFWCVGVLGFPHCLQVEENDVFGFLVFLFKFAVAGEPPAVTAWSPALETMKDNDFAFHVLLGRSWLRLAGVGPGIGKDFWGFEPSFAFASGFQEISFVGLAGDQLRIGLGFSFLANVGDGDLCLRLKLAQHIVQIPVLLDLVLVNSRDDIASFEFGFGCR